MIADGFESRASSVPDGRLLAQTKPMDRSKRNDRRIEKQDKVEKIESEPRMQEVWLCGDLCRSLWVYFGRIRNPGSTRLPCRTLKG